MGKRERAFLEFSPWRVEENADGCPEDRPYGVRNESSGDLEGCHATREEAQAQVDALYANVDESAAGEELAAPADAAPAPGDMPAPGEVHDCVDPNNTGTCEACGMPCSDHPMAMPDTPAEDATEVPMYAVLCVEGFDTGDGRILDVGGWDEQSRRMLPLPAWVQDVQSMWGHEGAFISGRWDTIRRLGDGRRIYAEGALAVSDDRGQWSRDQILARNLRFVSVDIGDADVEYEVRAVDEDGWPVDVLAHFTRYELMGATVVGAPAIAWAVVWLEGQDPPAEFTADLPAVPDRLEEPEVVPSDGMPILILATVGAARDLPLSERDAAWDADGAETRMRRRASSDGSGDADTIDWASYRDGFFYYDGGAAEQFGSYRLPFADVIDGRLRAVWRGITACAGVLSGARGGVDLPEADQEAIRGAVGGYYDRARDEYDDDTITPPWEQQARPTVAATLVAAAARVPDPPEEWFVYSDLHAELEEQVRRDGHAPHVRVFDGQRVVGFVAPFGVCHIGMPGCVTAPRSRTEYAYFATQEALARCCDDCDDPDPERRVPAGVLTMGATHADLSLPASEARYHYDHTGHAAARVAVGESEFGIWVAGIVLPGVSEERVHLLNGSNLSGDWRLLRGGLELVAALVCNVPGFPMVRPGSHYARAASGALVQTALVGPVWPGIDDAAIAASGGPRRPRRGLAADPRVDNLNGRLRALEAWKRDAEAELRRLSSIATPLRADAAEALAATIRSNGS